MSDSNISGADIVIALKKDKQLAEKEYSDKLTVSKKLEEDAALLQKHIHESSNPNPIVVTLIVLLVLLMVWLLYLYNKINLNGVWYDEQSYLLWHIKHNPVNSKLEAKCATQDGVFISDKISGEIDGKYLKLGDVPGVWSETDVVEFNNGGRITRLVG